MERDYDAKTRMKGGFPQLHKRGIISPCGETTPFVWTFDGRETLMREELYDPTRGTDPAVPAVCQIRNAETGEILSRFGEDCYYYSFYQENGTAYVLATVKKDGAYSGDEIRVYESRDLLHWESRTLLKNPGWAYFNTSLTKGPDGYVLLMEAGKPREHVGAHPFTLFFAFSKDMIHWEHLSPEYGFSKERYMGGPWMKWSRGWYYVISVTELPCRRYTNYVYRTKDFRDWEVGFYNPMLMPSEEDRTVAPNAVDITEEMREDIRTGFISSNSDIDMCDYRGKTVITYGVGNQLGYYYYAEAEYDGSVDELLSSYFI